jgi:hypothetical protein
MKATQLLACMLAIASPAFAQSASPNRETLMHVTTAFDLVVQASYAETAPLFGPSGERAWAGKHWNPQFIHPQPEHDVEGAVFTIAHGPYTATWVNTLFDLDARHFQYVYFMPDLMVTVIDVHFKPVSPASTAVHVVYTRTAITPQGNEHVAAMSESDQSSGKEWQAAIDTYLASVKPNR